MPSPDLMPTQPDLLRRLLDQVLAGTDVVVSIGSEAGRALLDEAAHSLSGQRCRVLQVAAGSPGGLSLSGLMAQVAGQPDLSAQDDEVLERGHHRLTVPDATCDRIVLLVGDAQLLQRAALRFVQFACRSGTALQLVFAGEGLPELLSTDDFAPLRSRLSAAPILIPQAAAIVPAAIVPAAMVTAVSAAAATAPVVVAGVPNRRRIAAWAGVGLGMAASVALGVWIGHNGLPTGPLQQTALAAQLPEASAATPLAAEALPPGVTGQIASSGSAALIGPIPAAPDTPPPGNAGTPAVPAIAPQPHAEAGLASMPSLAVPDAGFVAPAPAASRSRAQAPMPKQAEARPKESPPGPLAGVVNRSRPLAATRAPAAYARTSDEWDNPYARPGSGWRPAPPPRAAYEPWYQPVRPQPYIGTYTTDGYGVRTFRFGP